MQLKSVHTEKLQFMAPDRAGKYVYRLHVKSNSYAGLDQAIDLPFDVKSKSEVRKSRAISAAAAAATASAPPAGTKLKLCEPWTSSYPNVKLC